MNLTNAHSKAALEKGWRETAAILAAIMALIGGVARWSAMRMPRVMRFAALRQLRRAEAMTRRLLILAAEFEAARLPAPSTKTFSEARAAPKARLQAPGFAMLEPWPLRLDGRLKGGGVMHRPRIRSFDEPVKSVRPILEMGEVGLVSRLKALEAICTNPAPRIRRMARWLARRRPRGRRTPLRVGWPPGAMRGVYGDLLLDLDLFAREALDRMARPPP